MKERTDGNWWISFIGCILVFVMSSLLLTEIRRMILTNVAFILMSIIALGTFLVLKK